MFPALTLFVLPALFSALPVFSAPSSLSRSIQTKREVSAVSAQELTDFGPYTSFAAAAYCDGVSSWSCGPACSALPGFQVATSGGDGNDVQKYFIGYWPANDTIIVSHEGTNPVDFLSILTDAEIALTSPNTTLFPTMPSGVQLHYGFATEHEKTADIVLSTVQSLLQSTGASSVTCVGHSLGGALAQLDSLFLTMNLPAGTPIYAYTFGTPRVGNPTYAAFFDTQVPTFKRIDNELDIIPILPGRSLGFMHPQGEVHLLSSGNAVACPGNDDATDAECQILSVPNILDGDILDHLGPYNGISVGTPFCSSTLGSILGDLGL